MLYAVIYWPGDYKLLYKGLPNMHFLFYYLKEFNIWGSDF